MKTLGKTLILSSLLILSAAFAMSTAKAVVINTQVEGYGIIHYNYQWEYDAGVYIWDETDDYINYQLLGSYDTETGLGNASINVIADNYPIGGFYQSNDFIIYESYENTNTLWGSFANTFNDTLLTWDANFYPQGSQSFFAFDNVDAQYFSNSAATLGDYGTANGQFQTTSTATVDVPAPATFMLLGLGLLGIIGVKRNA